MRFTEKNVVPPWRAAKAGSAKLFKSGRGHSDWNFSCDHIEYDVDIQFEDFAKDLNRMRGRVLLGGLGPGVMAWNCCKHRKISKVTVIEFDADVIALLDKTLPPTIWTDRDKLHVVQADVTKFKTDERFDYFYDDTEHDSHADFYDFLQRVDVQYLMGWADDKFLRASEIRRKIVSRET